MKKLLTATGIVLVLAWSCSKDTVTEQYTFYRPVRESKEAVRKNIRSVAPHELINIGKLAVQGNYVYINEIDFGIHVIDNSVPSRPKNVAFIPVPGSIDITLKGNYLYADCFTDLVTIDISNPLNAVATQVVPNVFPSRQLTRTAVAYDPLYTDTSTFITGWRRVDTVIKYNYRGSFDKSLGGSVILTGAVAFASSAGGVYSIGTGVSGSLSRFGQLNNRLYAVSNSTLKIFNTVQPAAPSFVKMISMSSATVQTIFPYGSNLFIGDQSGMFVYDAQDPDNPKKLSQFLHVRSCDPVITDGNYAYVTLRGNGSCGGAANEMDVVDISNITAPVQIAQYALKNPSGLSKDGNLVFVCDGTDGLKVFNVSNPRMPLAVTVIPGMDTYDVIASGGVATMIAKDGFYNIRYSDPAHIAIAGKIAVSKN